MKELERRILRRLLAFCTERELIGPYQLEDDSVQIATDSEHRTFTSYQALRYLLTLMEQAELAEEFYKTLSG